VLCIGLHVFSIENRTNLTHSQNRNLIACCATSTFIFLIDLNAGTLIYLLDFKNMPYNARLLNVGYLLPQIVEFCLVEERSQINAAMHSLFQNEIHVIKCADMFLDESVSGLNSRESTRSTLLTSSEAVLSVLPRYDIIITKQF
jgi:hypothetical protein